ncbi:hypothetical protein RUND412_006646, partial [Rhizina undulata]
MIVWSQLEEARKIVKALGELPLALDQAGAHISSLQMSFSDYRNMIEKSMKAGLNKQVPQYGLPSYKASVFTTWELSFQELDDNARRLLHLCAFLGNEDIPAELFCRGRSGVDWIPEGMLRANLPFLKVESLELMLQIAKDENNAIEKLFEFSLAKRKSSTKSFWMHSLVHAWAREHTDIATQRQIAEDAITLVASAISTNPHESLQMIGSSSSVIKAANASYAIASTYGDIGYYDYAEESCQKALALYEKALGSEHQSILNTMNNMANIFYWQGRYDEALEWFGRALAGKEKTLESDHSSTLYT